MSEPSKGGCMASAVHELWMGTFTTRDGGGSSGANAQRGTCAASPGPLGKGRCDTVVWDRHGRPLRGQACGTGGNYPHASRAGCGHERWRGVWQTAVAVCQFTCIVRCFSSLGRLNDCECTNTLAQKRPLHLQSPRPALNPREPALLHGERRHRCRGLWWPRGCADHTGDRMAG